MTNARSPSAALLLFALLAGLAACAPKQVAQEEPKPAVERDLQAVLAAPWRVNPERDVYRHPGETLAFFDIDPSGTIVEVWPGAQGWYTSILAPWIYANGGKYIAAGFETARTDAFVVKARATFAEKYLSDPRRFGPIQLSEFGPNSGPLCPASSADAVLTFRNVHNWMGEGYAAKAFADFYACLKPGGKLGVEEHRAPSIREQDPTAADGYVQEAYVKQLAQEAGFTFVAASGINSNPADTKDHPFGVWTLPPTLLTAPFGSPPNPNFDQTKYKAIGESDRMTLLFIKPKDAPLPAAAPAEPAKPAGQ